MRTVKAILIDPFACEVKLVEIDRDDHRSYYPLLSHPTMPVDTFTSAYCGVLKGRDALFVDDEGLMKEPERWFALATAHQPFAGKGLIIGADAHGDAADAETSIDMVRMSTRFAETMGPHLIATNRPWEPRNEES